MATSVAVAFISGWVSRFGCPLLLITDRGAQFESELFSHLSSLLGFHHIRTTGYHPQSNGMIERFHRTLKSAIKTRKQNWFISLPIVLLGYRMTPNSSEFSPFTAVTGSFLLSPRPLISPADDSSSHEIINTFAKEMNSLDFSSFSAGTKHSSPASYIPTDLQKCSKVWLRTDRIRKSLEAPYTGPYEVVERSNKYFILKLPQGNSSVSIDRLKPAQLPPTPSSSSTPPSISSSPIPCLLYTSPSPRDKRQSRMPSSA